MEHCPIVEYAPVWYHTIDLVNNYRTISLLSLLSDVLKSHMTTSIRKRLLITNHVFVNQWDFRKGNQPPLPFSLLYINSTSTLKTTRRCMPPRSSKSFW